MAEFTERDSENVVAKAKEIDKTQKDERTQLQRYKDEVEKTKASFKNLMETRDKAKKTAQEANAENQAANADGVVSPWEAMQLIEQEAYAKKSARKMEKEAFAESVRYLTQSVGEGVRTVWHSGDSLLSGLAETVTDPTAFKTVGYGALAGLVLGDSPISDMVFDMFSSAKGLYGTELPDGVEEKYVDGLVTDEDYLNYAATNANGGSNGYVDPGQGGVPADTKEVPGGTKEFTATGVDALNTSPEEFARMSRIGEDLTSYLKQSDNVVLNLLGAAISTEAGQNTLQQVTSSLMTTLNGKVADMDKTPGTDGIPEPDFTPT